MATVEPVKQRLAAPAAIIAMFGSIGWIGGPAASRGSLSLLVVMTTFAVALAVGAIVYVWMQRYIEGLMLPLVVLERALRTSASRRRDHLAALRREMGDPGRASWEPARGVHDALGFFMRRVDDRQQRQTAWIGALVHDVKTPVAAAANALSTVSREVHTWTGQERELVQRVGTELRELATHVQDLLDAVRLDREDVELKRSDVDIAALVMDVIEIDRGRGDVLVTSEGHGFANGDVGLLRRAIDNLVANAVRYARSTVKVAVFPGLVRVLDDGPGLPADLDDLSEPFHSETLDLGGTQVHGGAAGMGLFLARRVLELHDGKLVVERSGPEGTVLLAYLGRPPTSRTR